MTYASSWEDYSFAPGPAGSFPILDKVHSGFRDHFVPHEGNNYHPHILGHRFLGLMSLLMVAVKVSVIAAAAFGPVATTYSSAITIGNVLSLTNESRTGYSLSALALNSKLALAAQKKADDMAAKGYFSHTTPDGHSPWWFIQGVGYSYITAGENLAVDFTQAENVETAWMNSPGHRANILNKNYEEIGIGIAQGQFQGHDTTFVVQMFGTPAEQKIAFQDKPTTVAQVQPTAAAPTVPAAPRQPAPSFTNTTPAPTQVAAPPSVVAAAEAPTSAAPQAPLQIIDTSTTVQGDQLLVSVTTAGPAVKVVADYNGAAVMLYPQSDTLWQGVVPLSSLSGEVTLTVKAADMQGHSQQTNVAAFAPSIQDNYKFLGNVKGATISVFGSSIDLKTFEQKFYLIIMAGLLVCLIMAIAIKRHIQHISLVANSSFAVILATLLWMSS